MKKYWKLSVITVLIVCGIGTFFVNGALTASTYPEFYIKKMSGNEKVVENLSLNGFYEVVEQGRAGSGLEITSKGTEYQVEEIFLKHLIGTYSPKIESLQEKYRGFMRGKSVQLQNYYENEQFLVYAEEDYETSALKPEDFKLELAILDKKTDKTRSFSVEVPNNQKINYMFVEDVQLINGNLKVLTETLVREGESYINEEQLYTIDQSKQKIIDSELVYAAKDFQSQGSTHVDVNMVHESNFLAPHDKIVFVKSETTEIMSPNASMKAPVENKKLESLIVYNLETNEKEKLDLSKKLSGLGYPDSFDGTNLYFTKLNENEFVVTSLNIESKETNVLVSVGLENVKNEEGSFLSTIENEKLYVFVKGNPDRGNDRLKVYDLTNGELIFEGEIRTKKSSENSAQRNLRLYHMTVN